MKPKFCEARDLLEADVYVILNIKFYFITEI